MQILTSEALRLTSEMEMVVARQRVRACSIELGFRLVDQTKIVTAASELARNMLIYGGGGTMTLMTLENGFRKGLRLVFEDQGPGIVDIEKALQDGYTTGSGLGMGLGGTRRLMNGFEIHSRPGEGTRITITKWI